MRHLYFINIAGAVGMLFHVFVKCNVQGPRSDLEQLMAPAIFLISTDLFDKHMH